jgi:tRNA 2-thiocytidine biosynthesis protein TtcA
MNPVLLSVSRSAGKAIVDYAMIQEGDKVAVAVSGGKDSMSLLHVLRHRQRVAPIHFTFTAAHIDFGMRNFDPAPLIAYLQKERFPYFVQKASSLEGEDWEEIDCFRWSKNRRKALFELAQREGFNKIAFGHHLDDIVETIILNQFYRGEIAAMKPKQELFAGKVTIIRPLAYVREDRMVQLAHTLGIHSIGQSKCANDDTSHRIKVKKMLHEFERNNPYIVKNIFHSLKNIRTEYLL